MSSRVNEVNGENFQDPPIKNPGYANEVYRISSSHVNSIAEDRSCLCENDSNDVSICRESSAGNLQCSVSK